jgi:hypothetical protein
LFHLLLNGFGLEVEVSNLLLYISFHFFHSVFKG